MNGSAATRQMTTENRMWVNPFPQVGQNCICRRPPVSMASFQKTKGPPPDSLL